MISPSITHLTQTGVEYPSVLVVEAVTVHGLFESIWTSEEERVELPSTQAPLGWMWHPVIAQPLGFEFWKNEFH